MDDGYRERPARPPLAVHVAAVWTATATPGRPVLPDGCADIVVAGGRVFVAGPDTSAADAGLAPGTAVTGIRFRPGHAPLGLGVAASELRDRRVELAQVWGRAGGRATEQLLDAGPPVAVAAALERLVAARLAASGRAPDPAVLAVAGAQAATGHRAGDRTGDGADPVAGLLVPARHGGIAGAARRVGLSERHLRRRFTAAVGYSPALFARIMRLQRFLALAAADPAATLAALAARAGYADQSHLARDCRDLGRGTATALAGRVHRPSNGAANAKGPDRPGPNAVSVRTWR